jgi:hypothetical protein
MQLVHLMWHPNHPTIPWREANEWFACIHDYPKDTLFDALPSPWLDPSWIQVNQTVELFGTWGTLPTLHIKKGKGPC